MSSIADWSEWRRVTVWMSLADNDECRHEFVSVEVSLDEVTYSCVCWWCGNDGNGRGCGVVMVTMIPPSHTYNFVQLKQTREKELSTFPRNQRAHTTSGIR